MRQDVWARFALSGPRLEPRRRSLRLAGYDYAQSGAYFVTICTEQRVCLFGERPEGEASRGAAHRMVCDWWEQCAVKFPTVTLDAYVVMPNHFHGIVIVDSEAAETTPTLGAVIGRFKTMTTNDYIRGVKLSNWTPFPGRLWQRNYHEHVIRSDDSLDAIRRYIVDNPRNWPGDADNPAQARSGP